MTPGSTYRPAPYNPLALVASQGQGCDTFEEVMQGYMETDPNLEEMELDDEANLADWEADEFV